MNASFWAIVAVFVVLGLAVLFLLLNVFLERRNSKLTIGVMVAGLFGVGLGWGAFYGGISMTGQRMDLSVSGFDGDMIALPTEGDSEQPPGAEGPPGGRQPPAIGGGGMPGMGGGRGGGGGGGRGGGGRGAPSSRRGLTTLVRKLDLLTGDIAVKFSTKQATEIGVLLAKAGGGEKMTDEQAKVALEAVEAALSDEQKAALERVGLPRRRRSGGGGGFGGFGGGGGGNQAPEDENPFTEEDNHTALVSLLKRHGVTPPKITVKKSQERPARPQTAGGGGGGRGAGGGGGGGGGGDSSSASVIEAILKQHDKDGDGALSKEEAPEFLRNRFDRIDTNKDGKCDLKEMTSARRLSPGG